MDRTKYEDIEPYRGERFEKAKVNLMARKEFIGAFAYMLSGDFSSVEEARTCIYNSFGVKKYV